MIKGFLETGDNICEIEYLTKSRQSLTALAEKFAAAEYVIILEKLARPEHLKAENLAQIIPFINQALWDAPMEKNGVLDRS